MNWIVLSLIYGLFNALYMQFNSRHKYNAYVLGIWRGFGIFTLILPIIPFLPFVPSVWFYLILIFQGIMIGIYDSHIFFASAKYGSTAAQGFLTTTILITTFIWWSIDFSSLTTLAATPARLISLLLILCGFSISYWNMMRVHINHEAEKYLYPAVFALSLMSIATKYIAVQGGHAYVGVSYYLSIACLVSGIYNLILFIKHIPPRHRHQILSAPIRNGNGLHLIFLSIILITAKTLALRSAPNPGYVMVILLLSPLFGTILSTRTVTIPRTAYPMLFFLILFLIWVT